MVNAMQTPLRKAPSRRAKHNAIDYEIRIAERADIPAMRIMQERSMRILGSHYYIRSELDAFLNIVGTMDDAVVDEGRFFIAVAMKRAVIGCGALSNLVPGYARVGGRADAAPTLGPATVRSVFVAPECTRRGIAHAIMQRIETTAAAAGWHQLQLTATLSGEGFYRAIGYEAEPRSHVALPDGTRFGCVKMRKSLAIPTAA